MNETYDSIIAFMESYKDAHTKRKSQKLQENLERPLSDLGLDSLGLVTLICATEEHFNIDIKASELPVYPTVRNYADLFYKKVEEKHE